MYEACKNGETKIVQLLLERCNSEESELNIKDEHGTTAFMWACSNGHKDVVKLLLDYSEGIDLNARDNVMKWTAFMLACILGHKDVVKLLLDHTNSNIDLNARDEGGYNGLERAYFNGHRDIAKLLLDHPNRIEYKRLLLLVNVTELTRNNWLRFECKKYWRMDSIH